MNTTDNNKANLMNSIFKDLKSDDNIKISAALKEIADIGDETLIEPILELYIRSLVIFLNTQLLTALLRQYLWA